MSKKIQVKNIPAELKKCDQWVVWQFQNNDKGELTKVPVDPIKGYPISIKNPNNWLDFETCMKYYKFYKYDGIGYVTNIDDPFVVWDFDDCRDVKTGVIKDNITTLITKLNSYTEISPSGKGIRLIVKGKIGKFGRRNRIAKIEIYDSKQFLTITGHHLEGTLTTIKKRNKICNKLHETIFKKQIKDGKKRVAREQKAIQNRKALEAYRNSPTLFGSNPISKTKKATK